MRALRSSNGRLAFVTKGAFVTFLVTLDWRQPGQLGWAFRVRGSECRRVGGIEIVLPGAEFVSNFWIFLLSKCEQIMCRSSHGVVVVRDMVFTNVLGLMGMARLPSTFFS